MALRQLQEVQQIQMKSLSELQDEFRADHAKPIQNEICANPVQSPDLTLIEPIYIEVAPPKARDALRLPDAATAKTGKAAAGKAEKTARAVKRRPDGKRRAAPAVFSDILFYFAIMAVLLAAFSSGTNSGMPRMVMGYSYFVVLTSSMQSEIPKGSFVVVKQTDPKKLNIGDNITYMLNQGTSVTHKIADIYENYENSGARGFLTKGVNNANADKGVVYEANIVGKVVFALPVAGAVMSYMGANIHLVVIMFGLCVILSFTLRGLFGKNDAEPIRA